MTYHAIHLNQARIAHEANSFRQFNPNRVTHDYRAEVDEVNEIARAKAESMPEFAEKAHALAESFAKRYAQWLNEGYRIDAMCPSVMVAGGGNFPARKKQRQNAMRDKHYKQLDEIMGIKERIRKLGTGGIQSGDPDAVGKLTAKADALQARQDAMKAANAHYRKRGTIEGFECGDAGIIEEARENLRMYGRTPFPPYKLQNNLANIKRTRQRIQELEAAREQPAQERTATVNGEQCRVVENGDAMRLQLIFDGKPEDGTRAILKKNGFRWSPRNSAWQRQLTDNARRALREIERRYNGNE